MKLIKCLGQHQIEVANVSVPEPGPGEVRVKTAVSALCGSEMGGYRTGGVAGGNQGHEAAGTIAAVGPGVTKLRVGTRVGVSAIAGCGHCEQCLAERYTWCDRFSFTANMHAESFVTPAHACHVLPDDVSWDVGVLITGDGLGVPYHTSVQLRNHPCDTVVVFGLGPIGLGHVLLQSHFGQRVIGVDLSPHRLSLAQTLGADEVVNASTDQMLASLDQLTHGRGADVCIEAAGLPVTARHCFAAVRKGGVVVFNGEQPRIEVSPSEDFIRRDITALGAWFYHFHEFTDMLALYRGGLDVASLITHRLAPLRAAEGYKLMDDGTCGKVVLDFSVRPNDRVGKPQYAVNPV